MNCNEVLLKKKKKKLWLGVVHKIILFLCQKAVSNSKHNCYEKRGKYNFIATFRRFKKVIFFFTTSLSAKKLKQFKSSA